MKIPLIILILTMTAAAQVGRERKIAEGPIEKQYKTSYDKFKDETTISSPIFTTNKLGEKKKAFLGVGVELHLILPGNVTKSDKATAWLIFSSMGSRDWAWLNTNEVTLLLDGSRLDLRVADRESKVGGYRTAYTYEELYFKVDPGILRQVVAAKKVEVQAGPVEFEIHDASLTVFRNMLSLTEK
jgi:hypothetical protein